MAVAFCTVASANHSDRIRALAASLYRHYPGATLQALIMDKATHPQGQPEEDNIRWMVPSEVSIDPVLFLEMASMYSALELSCALKPFLARHLILSGAEVVVYLDSDTWVLEPFGDFIREADDAGVVLTPHVRRALAPARQLTDVETITLKAGLINMGVFAVSRGGVPFLDWLADRLKRESIHDPDAHRNADQRWVDLATTIFPHSLTRDEGVNVGWWSFAGTEPGEDMHGRLLIGGTVVKVFHLSGFDLRRPWLLSTHAGSRPHALLSRNPELRRACLAYAGELNRVSTDADEQPYGFSAIRGGVILDARIRRIYREAVWHADRGSGDYPPVPLIDPDGFRRWLDEPTGALAPVAPLSRYLRDVYDRLPGVSARFPDVDRDDGPRFLEWCRSDLGAQHEVQGIFVQPNMYDAQDAEPPEQQAEAIALIGEVDRPGVRQEDALPESLRSALGSVGIGGIVVEGDRSGAPTSEARALLGGSMSGCLGSVIAAATPALPMLNHAFHGGKPTSVQRAAFVLWHYDVLDETLRAIAPEMDKILVPSRFSGDAFRRELGIEPVVVGMPLPRVDRQTRRALDPESGFQVYAAVDLDDGGYRDAPDTMIAAVQVARSHVPELSLLIGLRGADRWIADAERWRIAATEAPGVRAVDLNVRSPIEDPYVRAADAVISTHRTEAFLWTSAIAMAAGIPVAATAYGGNLDYMDEKNAWLIEPTRVCIPVDTPGAPVGCRVADIDPVSFGETIATIAQDREAREARSRLGLAVAELFSPERIGRSLGSLFDEDQRTSMARSRFSRLLGKGFS